jgi:ABC-type molybdate transport system ATPase subunit
LAIPVLYVSHDAREIARLADHLLVMHDGRVAAAEATASPAGLEAAKRRLDAMTPEDRERHALAAILAGLTPPPG